MVHSRRVTVARARPLASSSRAKLSISARRTANRFREWTRHQVVNWRRSRAYASHVRPRYPARKPASASRSASLNTGWMGTRVVVVVAVIGYLPVRAEAGRLGQARPQRNTRPPPSRRRACHVMSRCPIGRRPALGRDAFEIADSERPIDYGFASTGQYRTARSGALVTVGSPGWPRAVIIGNGSPGR